MNAVEVEPPCGWSTHLPDERAGVPVPAARYRMRHERPCGHAPNIGKFWSLACESCTASIRAQGIAGRATVCDRCGETNRPSVVAVMSL